MLESFNSGKFEYKKLSLEEQKQRGILGRLVGCIADFKNPTRNGRRYSEALWDRVFQDKLMKERIDNRICVGELGHPSDRTEVDMEKIAICLAEQPKKGKDGKLYGVFDILSTPSGRILKSLCDYGCNIGISSRGEGDLITGYDGQEEVDPETYECTCWDAVLIPAVAEARLKYVTESLDKTRYNKTLRQSLAESLGKASEEDRKIMQESLDSLGISLNEETENIDEEFTSPDTCIFERDDALVNGVKAQPIAIFNGRSDGNDVSQHAFEKLLELFNNNPNIIYDAYGCAGNREYAWDDTSPAYISISPQIVRIIRDDNGDLNLAQDDPEHTREVFIGEYRDDKYYGNTDPDCTEEIEKALDNGQPVFQSVDGKAPSKKKRPVGRVKSTHPKRFGKMVGEEMEEIQTDDKLNEEIDAGATDVVNFAYNKFNDVDFVGEDERGDKVFLRFQFHKNGTTEEEFKQGLIDEFGDGVKFTTATYRYAPEIKYLAVVCANDDIQDENLNESENNVFQKFKYFKDKINSTQDVSIKHLILDCAKQSDLTDDMINELYELVDNAKDESLNINEAQASAVDNNEAIVEELQNTIKHNQELEQKLVELQEKLSVCYAKESKNEEIVGKYKSTVQRLAESAKQVIALQAKTSKLEEKINEEKEKQETLKEQLSTAKDKFKSVADKNVSLKESVSGRMQEANDLRDSIKSLNEQLQKSIEKNESDKQTLKEAYSKKIKAVKESVEAEKEAIKTELNESIAQLQKDKELQKSEFNQKLEQSQKIVEKYKKATATAVDKYIGLQAVKLGSSVKEIKNRLPESYSFSDIDKICEDLQSYNLSMSKLPISTLAQKSLKEDIKIKGTSSKNEALLPANKFDDDIDEDLLYLAGK